MAILLLGLGACSSDSDQSDQTEAAQEINENPAAPASQDSSLDADTLELDDQSPEDETGRALLEDYGFSEAQNDIEQLTATPTEEAPELYCLDSQSESQISLEQACDKISNRLSSVSYDNCSAAKLNYSGCSSTEGFPILVREFPPIDERKPKGRILVVGGTHGDELTSVSVMFRWIDKLNRFHSGLYHWHMVPMMNPDGVLKKEASRTNANGVDLNRNLPTQDWDDLALKYWETKSNKNQRKFPGDKPASEPEVQWLIDEIETFKPDAIIAVHAPYGIVDFDSQILNTAPKSLGKLHLNLLGTYPGSLGNYAGIDRNIPVITLELPHSWVMMSSDESTKIWEDIVSWLKRNVGPELAYNAGQPDNAL